MTTESSMDLGHAVTLLGVAVVTIPLFRRMGLGSVLGYLAAGVFIGPFGVGVFKDPTAILHVAELGVVLFLFVIGLEMRPAKLWDLRKDIFGLGVTQVLTACVLLTGVAMLFGLGWKAAFVGAAGFVMSSTAVIMKMLDERRETATPAGQRSVSILLLEDLSVIPLLAIVGLLGATAVAGDGGGRPAWLGALLGLACLSAVIVGGKWLLNPIFRLLAKAEAREIMTAAALLVVLGTALFMQWGGLSMALGAFMAGVLLSDSSFRHQLEADIEPFRGLLLGLFFLSVGMSLDLLVVKDEWGLIVGILAAFTVAKAAVIYGAARLFRADNSEAVLRAASFAQGGEFAFVLYAAAVSSGVLDARMSAILAAVVILSMAVAPLLFTITGSALPATKNSTDDVEEPSGLKCQLVMIGFGRFAQVACQPLLAKGFTLSLIEKDVNMIRLGKSLGFKVYYGDGSRLDVLRAAGAETAHAILVCVDDKEDAVKITEAAQEEFPNVPIFARAFDREHAVRLIEAGADYQIRETFESAITFGGDVLTEFGVSIEEAAQAMLEARQRDEERLELQLAGAPRSSFLIHGNT